MLVVFKETFWRRGWDSSAFAKATAGSHRVGDPIPPKLALNSDASEGGWRRRWDSHQCWVLKTKNLRDSLFLTIRAIRQKTQVEARFGHVKSEHAWVRRERPSLSALLPQ